jgi:small-conductance mechanosensitive channel
MEDWTETQKLLLQLGLTLLIGLVVLLVVLRGLETFGKKFQLSRLALSPLRFIVKWAGFLIVIAACLHPLGVNIGHYILSVLGLVAIGFVAVWSVISNVSCTFILILLKPFRVDDVIEFVGEEVQGRVVDLNLIFTTLKTSEGDEIKIPNNLFFQKILRKKEGKGLISLGEQLYEEKPAE